MEITSITIPVIYALGGFLLIMSYLMGTGHAVLLTMGGTHAEAGCPDKRVNKDILVFGGSSAFTFGLAYFVLGIVIGGSWKVWLFAYGGLQFGLSLLQTLTFLLQLPGRKFRQNITLKGHFQGCGFTTAWSPLWPLFFIQKIPGFGWIVYIRDLLTMIDWVLSLPATIIFLNLFTVPFIKKLTLPAAPMPVDTPNAH